MIHELLILLVIFSVPIGGGLLCILACIIDDMLYNRSRGLPLMTYREDNPWGGR